jgi:hypothetical protein
MLRTTRAALSVLLRGWSLPACTSAPDPAAAAPLAPRIEEAFTFAEARVDAAVGALETAYPEDYARRYLTATRPSGPEVGRWMSEDPTDWRSGFFPGVLWELYRHTRAPATLARAKLWTRGLADLKDESLDHDLGFRFVRSFGEGLRLLDDESDPGGAWRANARRVVLDAAASLDALFDAGGVPVGALCAVGRRSRLGPYPVYTDSIMNVELLLLAWDIGGRPATGPLRVHYEHAIRHAETVIRENVRPNGSTYHIVLHDDGTMGKPPDGRVIAKISDQGFASESTWSRGQAWAIYGFTRVYRYTKDDPAARPERFLSVAERIADYFIDHLPAHTHDPYNHAEGDFVPPSDFDASLGEPPGPFSHGRPGTHVRTPRDTSAAAIAAAGLLELGLVVEERALRERYLGAAEQILASLLGFRGPDGKLAYLARDSVHRGILAAGAHAYGMPQQSLSFGDAYFLEAMNRCLALPTLPGETRACGGHAR